MVLAVVVAAAAAAVAVVVVEQRCCQRYCRSVRQSEGDKGDAKVQRHTCAGIPNWPLIQVCLVPPATAESTPVTRRQDCTLKGSFENLFSNASIFFFFRQIF
ncbi:hypothetical protein O3P69_018877 [Scylla paramamosain]|uniref:Secreted protein n=1 Tax=Scylla paramamosain TaxID=85552 RepID=A0AAW0SSV5_SCYPA